MTRRGKQPDVRSRMHRQPVSAAAQLSCASAFQTLARGCVTDLKAQHSKACSGDSEAIHQMRVSVTRLRAAVAFFAPMRADPMWLRLKKDIAWLHATLGAARDSDVLATYARRKHYRAWAKSAGIVGLDQGPSEDHRSLARCLRSVRFSRLMERLSAWIRSGVWVSRPQKPEFHVRAQSLGTYSTVRLERWRVRLVHKGRHFTKMGNSRRHHLRIRAKRYRYMLEALMDMDPKHRSQWRRQHELTKRLQRMLGDLRDLQSLRRAGADARRAADDKLRCPPGYRHRQKTLLAAAASAFRDFKRAGAH